MTEEGGRLEKASTRSPGGEGISRRELMAFLGGSVFCSIPAERTRRKQPAPSTGPPSDPLVFSSAASLARAIRGKKVSSEEVVRACLARIEVVNPHLNAVVTLVAEASLARAREADAALARGELQGPLHGVPMTIKDSLDTAGVITTGGTRGRASFVPTEDATVVARLRAAGAVLLGKTNTPELTLSFETDNDVYGRTNNPYDLTRTPGGSSGGAAAILAAGGSPLDLGSDTGGSIRLPCHFCGIVGMKPTGGRVPRTGHIIPFGGVLDSLTQIGPMARWVEDLALTLPIIAGVDGHDPGVIPMTLRHPRDVSLERLRVAFYTDNGISTPAPEITAAVRRAAEVLSDSVGFVEEDRPPGIEDSLVYGDLVVATLGVDRWLREAGTKRPHELLRGLLARQRATVMRASDLDELVTRWDRFRLAMHSFLAKYDLILCPVHAGAALPHGTTSEPDKARGFSYTPAYNLTGWPAVVVRTGATREGLPVGVQVVAQPWREDVALAAAQHIETALGGWRRPDL